MSGANAANGSHPDLRVEQVVKDFSKRNPPYWVWQGKFLTLLRIASHLPVGPLDSSMKRMVGLDEVERKVKELGG